MRHKTHKLIPDKFITKTIVACPLAVYTSKICAIKFYKLVRRGRMAFIVTDNCIRCKYTDCVEVCPVDCFYEGPNFLVINPDECIDCGLCEPECPANAIFSEDELPENQEVFVELNQDLSQIWPNITEKKEALPDAAEWDGVEDKLEHLER